MASAWCAERIGVIACMKGGGKKTWVAMAVDVEN
jgi:hypothetical protein